LESSSKRELACNATTYLDLTIRNLGDGLDRLGNGVGTDGREGKKGQSVTHVDGVGGVWVGIGSVAGYY
jgi:hypothetical protein